MHSPTKKRNALLITLAERRLQSCLLLCMGNFSSLFSNADFFFYLLWVFSFLVGLVLGWVGVFSEVQTYLLSSPSRNLTAARVREKSLTQRVFKARRQEGLCSSLGRGQGMEQVTCLKGARRISCHSMVQGKVNQGLVKAAGLMV